MASRGLLVLWIYYDTPKALMGLVGALNRVMKDQVKMRVFLFFLFSRMNKYIIKGKKTILFLKLNEQIYYKDKLSFFTFFVLKNEQIYYKRKINKPRMEN